MESLHKEELQKQIENIKAEKLRISNMQHEIDTASSDLAGRLYELEKELNEHKSQLAQVPQLQKTQFPPSYKRSINIQGYISTDDFNAIIAVVNHYRSRHKCSMTMSTLFRLVLRHFLDHQDSIDVMVYWNNDGVVALRHSGQKPKGKASVKGK